MFSVECADYWALASMNLRECNFAIHNDGWKFVGALAIVSIIFMIFSAALGWIAVVLTLFCAFFFRNPKRVVINNDDLIVSMSDGAVSDIKFEVPPQDIGIGDEPRYRISVFLSVFDVHVNRMPFSGTVKNILYHPGAFLNASLDKSSIFNERNTIVLSMLNKPGSLIAFTQIAGTLARRIVCDIHDGQEMQKGKVFGMIRFGSRCDVWLPVGAIPSVAIGQTMVGGETVISHLSSNETELPIGIVI